MDIYYRECRKISIYEGPVITDQTIFNAILQGFNSSEWLDKEDNYLELQAKGSDLQAIFEGYEAKERAEFDADYPIFDEKLAKYEVEIMRV